jgi:hypothetical protein
VIAPLALDAHRAVRRMIARGSHRVGHRQASKLKGPDQLDLGLFLYQQKGDKYIIAGGT